MAQLGRGATLARLLAVSSALAVLVHLFGLYRPTGPPSVPWFPSADKVEHLTGFASPLCLILLAGLGRPLPDTDAPTAVRLRDRFAATAVGLFAVHAVVSELIQHFFYRHRTGDPLDALADLLGVALGWAVARLLAPRIAAALPAEPALAGAR